MIPCRKAERSAASGGEDKIHGEIDCRIDNTKVKKPSSPEANYKENNNCNIETNRQ